MTTCIVCQRPLPEGANFCPLCGARQGRNCPACGAPAEAEHVFCLRCGSPLDQAAAPVAAGAPPREVPAAAGGSSAERRLVSILFVDLVGFTTMSDRRDAEEVRELLTRYFDTARRVIARYGGTVEKFIGDAVMAVWGAPTAREDDAERTVRAALDLVAAVAAMGADIGRPELRARAGIVTGEAAVTVGAVGQGMVAGDAVNTASRIQTEAEPGTVLVDDATRRTTDSAIDYEDAGRRELKGKAEPVQLWQATRVIATVRGGQRGPGLEAPFVGRDRELRLVKDLFHATVEEGRPRLVSITGLAGIGKSRLAWEFEKYIDGVADLVFWHRGRCLSYGEGVTYWALAEMVRSRAGIVEGDTAASAWTKLRQCLDERIPDADERAWLEPRLAHLLGLEERANADRIDLFAAWRVFFERLAERQPAVLVFEEMQWADSGLVEFIEYMLDWSRHHPLYVLTLTRPEFADRFPSWGAGKRSFHALHLEPLPPRAMDELLTGLVPGLPPDLRARIRDRAEGVPLYAVETVRMLLDRGTLRRDGNRYVLTGPAESLDVPETLHALIAARLDTLSAPERDLMQAGAVLGQTFTVSRVAAVVAASEDSVRQLLDGLVRKELLTVEADPRSPERGQYGFLQALMQKVAYDTLSRRDRKSRHLAAARQLEGEWAGETDEVVEVVASHYVEAYRSNPHDADATALRDSAHRMLMRAGQRAASLGAADEALRNYVQAADLVDDPTARAAVLERAAEMATQAGRLDEAVSHYESATSLFESAGDPHAAARTTAWLGRVMFLSGQPREALQRINASYEVLRPEVQDGDLGAVAAEKARLHFFLGEEESAHEPIEVALDIAEAHRLPGLLCESLITKSFIVLVRGHQNESVALLRHALAVALERELFPQALRAYFNLVASQMAGDQYETALRYADEGLALARRRGDRGWEWMLLGCGMDILFALGRWDDLVERLSELPEPALLATHHLALSTALSCVHAMTARGEADVAEAWLHAALVLRESEDLQERCCYAAAEASHLQAAGRSVEALGLARRVLEDFPAETGSVAEALAAAGDAALALGDVDALHAILALVDTQNLVFRTDRVRGYAGLLRARLAAAADDHDVAAAEFAAAEAMLGELGLSFPQARSRLAHAEWLASLGDDAAADALLTAAEDAFGSLRAVPWLQRAAALRATMVERRQVEAGA